jgi:hypothetical protein
MRMRWRKDFLGHPRGADRLRGRGAALATPLRSPLTATRPAFRLKKIRNTAMTSIRSGVGVHHERDHAVRVHVRERKVAVLREGGLCR